MYDKPISRSRSCISSSVALSALVLSTPVLAGEEIIYAPAPDWVDVAKLPESKTGKAPSTLVYDWQGRLEDGVVTAYLDTAVRIDTPDQLAEEGTLTMGWLPDKGDLTIHRVEILRDGKPIDVIASGAEFDIIRREQGLEQRLIDGELTATLAVPGLKVGDILRVSQSITTTDQALGDEMQASYFLYAEPWQVGFSRVIVSWPEDADVRWGAEDIANVQPPLVEDGYRKLTVELPLAKQPDMPADSPIRYRRSPVLRVGTFADWQEMSRVFAPHFTAAAQVADDGEVAAEAARIAASTSDPLERAQMALQMVQDDVSYLLDGLDGGNYIPQQAEDTWAKRYGDCKAKTALLLALLGRLGIDAEPVLVSTKQGDVLTEVLPIPGNFDHVIARARIGGQDYWLDGTSTGTRMTNIAEVPAFYHGLPLTAAGSDLVAVTQREQPWPDMVMSITSDYSAGLDFPALFDLDMRIYGAQGAGLRQVASEANIEELRELASGFSQSAGAGSAVNSITVDYDDAAAAGIIRITGIVPTSFEWKDGRMRAKPDNSAEVEFNPDRARPEWRDIPVLTPGPRRNRIEVALILPDDGEGYVLKGERDLDASYANTRIVSHTEVDGPRIATTVDVIEALGEIAPADLAAEKRKARQLAAIDGELMAPENMTWRWEIEPKRLAKLTRPLAESYDKAVEFAGDDDYGPLVQRAVFNSSIYDWDATLADLDTLIEKDTKAGYYGWRATILDELGRRDEALADARAAFDLDPSVGRGLYLGELLAYAGAKDEALELLESLPVTDEDSGSYASTYATVAGLAGQTDRALAHLNEEVAEKPSNASILNADCWFRGLFNVGVDDALPTCTRAIERANNSAPMLDSRAMVSYRRGDYEAAIKDLDSALALTPGVSASMYLRGIVRLEKGDAGGKEDIEQALRISPGLSRRYAAHGVVPKS